MVQCTRRNLLGAAAFTTALTFAVHSINNSIGNQEVELSRFKEHSLALHSINNRIRKQEVELSRFKEHSRELDRQLATLSSKSDATIGPSVKKTGRHWSDDLEYENFELVDCPIHPLDHPLLKEIAGKCVSPNTTTSLGMCCRGPYGLILPPTAAFWGREKVDWQTHEAKTLFGGVTPFTQLRDVLAEVVTCSQCGHAQSVNAIDGWGKTLGEEYYERLSLMYAGHTAPKSQFIMIEVGAGYFKWLLEAHNFMRINHPKVPLTLIGLESDPMTMDWARMATSSNGVKGGHISFLKGVASVYDGDMLLERKNNAMSYGGHIGYDQQADDMMMHSRVPAFALATVVQSHWMVDHVDMDCNGCEMHLFANNATNAMLIERVRTMFIETHTPEAHQVTRQGLLSSGWHIEWEMDFHSDTVPEFDWGFGKDVRGMEGFFWVKNPKLDMM